MKPTSDTFMISRRFRSSLSQSHHFVAIYTNRLSNRKRRSRPYAHAATRCNWGIKINPEKTEVRLDTLFANKRVRMTPKNIRMGSVQPNINSIHGYHDH